METWVGKLVKCKTGDFGVWKVIWWGNPSKAKCVPHDETSRQIAKLSVDGVAWIRKSDLQLAEIEGQEELL